MFNIFLKAYVFPLLVCTGKKVGIVRPNLKFKLCDLKFVLTKCLETFGHKWKILSSVSQMTFSNPTPPGNH